MKILFVDDEPGVARALAERVGAEGVADCYSAESAQEAVDLVNASGAVDVLVTAASMKDCDGLTLNTALREHLPDLRTIFLSEVDLSDQADRVGGAEIFARPVDPDALAAYLKGGVPDGLVGKQIGQFRIDRRIGTDANGPVYEAFQTNISRSVELHTLDPNRGDSERFLASASLKANVRHPAVLAVFEAGEAGGIYFYAAEPPQGVSLSNYLASGRHMSAADAILLMQTVAEAMSQFSEAGVSRESLGPERILIDHRNRARISNLATASPADFSAAEELREFSNALGAVIERRGQIGPILQLLDEMGVEDGPVRTWTALLHEIKRRAPQSTPTRRIALDAEDRAAIAAVGASRKRQKMASVLRWIVALGLIASAAAVGFWYFAVPMGGKMPGAMVQIPAGAVNYENGKQAKVPAFWVDKNEVSIAEYAEFLAWLKRHPDGRAVLDHPSMPAGKSHVPSGWEPADGKPGIYETARKGGVLDGRRLRLTSPVFNVDWFDAYSYALWKHDRRLPTDEEWDRLALQQDGSPKEAKSLSGLDGNVSEWTFTWVETDGKKGGPVVRGGDSSKPNAALRLMNVDPLSRSPNIGFRTASENPPPKE